MNKYKIRVIQTINYYKVVVVEANNVHEAVNKVEEDHKDMDEPMEDYNKKEHEINVYPVFHT